MFTFLALWTGSLWGKPTWGTWWVWDARLTSELILLFLYIGFIALQASIDDARRADKAGAVLALVGVVNIPIIYFSVQWWNTLHQGSSINFRSSPTMAAIMLTGMLLMALGFWAYTFAAVLMRLRSIILERERHVVCGMAGRGNRLNGPARASDDLAIGQCPIRFEFGIVAGLEAGHLSDMQGARGPVRPLR